jgi:hypothetical protein
MSNKSPQPRNNMTNESPQPSGSMTDNYKIYMAIRPHKERSSSPTTNHLPPPAPPSPFILIQDLGFILIQNPRPRILNGKIDLLKEGDQQRNSISEGPYNDLPSFILDHLPKYLPSSTYLLYGR